MPALTATSVNGDRDAGVLATLQTTLLSAADIIVGKLLASLVMALTFVQFRYVERRVHYT